VDESSGNQKMRVSRRTLMKLAGVAPAAKLLAVQAALGEEMTFAHALTLYDDIKYPADFKHYDYVNPDAPKGGKVRLYLLGSFDSLNTHTIKGDNAGVATDETLVTRCLDEPNTDYGLVASGIWFPEDRSRVVFRLRPEAKFHDGKPMTPEDVIWSLMTLKETHPQYQVYWKNIVKAEQTGDHDVTMTFDKPGNRELPSIAAQVPVLAKHWWTGKDANGKDRSIEASSLEIPLGSGPYRIDRFRAGQSLTLKRVEDYWGKDQPVNIGQNNFDEVEYSYFRDQQVAFEAFKGDQYDYRFEASAKSWATGYDFPAVKDGRVIKEKYEFEEVQPIQAWILNLRRPQFQDERVRRAFNLAFDFEWTNANLFYGEYARARSIFNHSEFEAKGLPSAEELKLLEPLKADLPPSVFTEEFKNPASANPQERRKNLREASKLFAEAGWRITKDGGKNVLKNGKGEVLKVEFMLDSPVFERIALPYSQALESLGVVVTVRTIDPAQYVERTKNFDFDILNGIWGQSLSPGNEQREFWGTESADRTGSRNYSGIKNKAIDTLIENVIFVKDRASLVIACRALDRAVMAHNYFVPMWYGAFDRIARWDRFGKPDKMPKFALGFPSIWWWDEAKARKVKG
jgi:microcin C transport system substrate-binding protein